jgi:hypothetical protein
VVPNHTHNTTTLNNDQHPNHFGARLARARAKNESNYFETVFLFVTTRKEKKMMEIIAN